MSYVISSNGSLSLKQSLKPNNWGERQPKNIRNKCVCTPRTSTNLLITQTFKILWISYIIWSVHVNGSLDSQAAVEDEGYNVPVATGTGPMKGLSTVLKQGVIFRAFFVQPIFRSQSQVCLKGFSQAKYTTGRILISGHFLEDRLRIQKK